MKDFKDFLNKMNEDKVLKAKVIRASIFFGLFIVGISVYFLTSGKEDKKEEIKTTNNKIVGRIVPADTTAINTDKTNFFRNHDSINVSTESSSSVLGGSMVEQQQQTEVQDQAINQYLSNRRNSVNRMQSSGSTYVPPAEPSYHRRNYNPSGNSSDWTSDQVNVVSSRITTDQPVIAKNNNYDPQIIQAPTQTQQDVQQSQKTLTKEEKLQQAISKKYGKKNALGNASVSAQIYNNQTISGTNNSVRIVLLEKLQLPDGTWIGTDAFIFGVASLNGSNATISVPSISYKEQNYSVNLEVYDYRTGERGIPIKQDNIVGNIENQAKSQAMGALSSVSGKYGSIVSGIFSGKNKSASIVLNGGHRIYLKSK